MISDVAFSASSAALPLAVPSALQGQSYGRAANATLKQTEEPPSSAPVDTTAPQQSPAIEPVSADNMNVLLQAQSEECNDPTASGELTEEEQKEVEDLKKRDEEVRAHEQAHKTAGGPYAGAISYETTTGPDGREYAISGEVEIDISPVSGNPEATIRKMEIVERAALASAEPSPQDQAAAQAAQQAKLQAQQEVNEQRKAEEEEQRGEDDSADPFALPDSSTISAAGQQGASSSTSSSNLAGILFTQPSLF